MSIPFNKPSVVGNEEKYLLEALRSGKWAGRGPKTLAFEKLTAQLCDVRHAFFVTSGTSALEIGCLLSEIGPGDEVIIPSFAFVSAANAVVLRGAKPVFADVDRETWNITRETIAPVLTRKTKAIIPVHYSGSSAGIDEIRELCKERNIFLIEDAAQSLGAKRNGKAIGGSPWVTCFSLHDTKNVTSGEGGLIMTDSDELAHKIEILIEKGTNRQVFLRGQVDKYTWVSLGSSYIASDLLAAIALGQMEKLPEITAKRIKDYRAVREGLKEFDSSIHWQKLPKNVEFNGHVIGFVMDPAKRPQVLSELKKEGVTAIFHYVPLHDAPFARELGVATTQDLPNTRWVSEGLVRLPSFVSMASEEVDEVIGKTRKALKKVL